MSKCQNVNPSSADAAHPVVVAYIMVNAVAAEKMDAPRAVDVVNFGGSTPKMKYYMISKTYEI